MADVIKPAAVDAWNAHLMTLVDQAQSAIEAVMEGTVDRTQWDIVHTSEEDLLLVVSDGSTELAAQYKNDQWKVYYVINQDGEWTQKKEVTTLEELGEVLS